MRAIECEMCGSHDIIKQDGYYVCQSCGTKYSPEDAKKLIVEVSGTVRIDSSDELNNLRKLARRAKNENNDEIAKKFYDQILIKDPDDWEAAFYAVYYQTVNCSIEETGCAMTRLSYCENTVFGLIRDHVTDPGCQKNSVNEVATRVTTLSDLLFNTYKQHYDRIDPEKRSSFRDQYRQNCSQCRDALYFTGDTIISVFGDVYGDAASSCWKAGVRQHTILLKDRFEKKSNRKIINSYNEKILKYDPSYDPSENDMSRAGCYIATAVYGSYDCPEVWTLRRYRDNTLSRTWYGRIFIRAYYAVSPRIVKWFGKTDRFNRIWRSRLDNMVRKLNHEGVESTPYTDKNW